MVKKRKKKGQNMEDLKETITRLTELQLDQQKLQLDQQKRAEEMFLLQQ